MKTLLTIGLVLSGFIALFCLLVAAIHQQEGNERMHDAWMGFFFRALLFEAVTAWAHQFT